MSTLYNDLGVQDNCSQEEIEKAYRKAALRYHPDRNPGDNEAAVIFLKIQQAYDILKDESKRREYDYSLRHNNVVFHQQVHEHEDLDIRIAVQVNFDETVIGTKKTITFNKKFACYECGGNGYKKFNVCHGCNGTGNLSNLIAGFFNFQTPCHSCGGKGKTGTDKCGRCNGEKYINQDSTTIDIIIPAGIRHGMILTIAGHGNIGKNGRIGNVLIQTLVQENKKYSLKNLDIHFNFEIDFSTMVFGGKIEIPTFDNELIELDIPPKTQCLTNFRIKNKGMPSINNNMLRGDLVATVIANIPTKDFPPELLPVLKYHQI